MRQTMTRLMTCLAAFCAMAAASAAETFNIEKIVVPYAAGGVTDLYGRVLAASLEKDQDDPIIVENRPGGGAAIGTAHVAKSPADGRTLLLGSVGTSTNPAMIKSLPYDPADIVPVAQVAVSPLILYVRAGMSSDVRELVAYARKNPGHLTFANSGIGSSPNLAAALFAKETGVQVTHVSYRGTSAAINDFLGGQVDAYFDTLQAMTHVKAGRIQAIGVAAPQRLKQAPDLPTLDELGIANVHASSWWGIFVPAGTPQDTIRTLQTRLRATVEKPETQAKAIDMGTEAVFSDQATFRQFFNDEVTRWTSIIKAEQLSGQ